MKKIAILPVLFSLFNLSTQAQTIKASIGSGSTANSVKIYLKADATLSAQFSTLQFNVGVDTTGVTVPPTLTVVSTTFASVTWGANAPYKEGKYWNYNITTSSSPITQAVTANTEFEAMEVSFTGASPANLANVALVSLPDGGTVNSGFAIFYATGNINSNGLSNLYYLRSGITVDNQDSYDPAFNIAGTGTSVALIPSIVVPVRFTGFTVAKNSGNALINWSIENESAVTDHYELERSFNGTNFSTIATILPKNNGSSRNSYDYTDANLASLRSSGIIYYRIKQVDRDGKTVYTEIKNVRLDSKSFAVSVFPNPVKSTTNISIDLVDSAPVSILIIDAAGKQVQTINLQGFKGLNTKKISMEGLAAGNYLLKVKAGEEVKTIPVVKSN